MDNLTAALAYAKANWYLVPVERGTKNPGSVVHGKWQEKSSRDPKQIVAWFAGTDYSIALHCGRSGAVVFDVDDYEAMPDALIVAVENTSCPYQSTRPEQPGRGHYLFSQPKGRLIGNRGGKLGDKFGEVRGLNGVIIVANSFHKAGEYAWRRVGPVPEMPDYLADELPDVLATEDAATDAQVLAFIAEHTGATRPEILEGPRNTLIRKIEEGCSRHKSTTDGMIGVMREARAGYYSAQDGIDKMRTVFTNAATMGEGKRTPRKAADEFAGILAWAIAQANASNLDEVHKRVAKHVPPPNVEDVTAPAAEPITLAEAHAVFRKWLGKDYDVDALDAVLATAAAEKFEDGSDPVWLLIIGGPGNAKTETVQACDGIGATVTSSISSEAALLSATPKNQRAKNATGGLLRKVGERGVLVVKDVTTILSMNRDQRANVLAALREIYDGRWYREVGTDGGQTIEWRGRIAVIGAVTTAWDAAHAVVSSMGDRFVLVRLDSTKGRQAAGRKAIGNTGDEPVMRAEMAAAVAGVLAGMNPTPELITETETNVVLAAADLVTLARTGVEYDYRGDVIDAHAPEMPTRFAKQLTQIIRGGVALGMERDRALRLAIRCARDSMPPMRLAIIDDVAANPRSSTPDVRKRIDKPRNTVDRQLQALHMLGVLTVDEVEYGDKNRWFYTLAEGIDPDSIKPGKCIPEMSEQTHNTYEREGEEEEEEQSPDQCSDISGIDGGCLNCGAELHSPASLYRGYCERCRLDGKAGAA